ncbi:WbbJ Acetyltransferase (isoleucine patch superfamily) [uncultured Caudovirales phage]|uniref:WbbJ Acetyltransferase (Isoleucine patch superfamily) n=1 Tax=uncultured Caudovirales phage TaxID=2100421 RepID=A0A6J5LK43_9CAUD|nr:WbbJ Acetyltransferase (isoleucine patch superfamily) [uncultured Caudovirales phage]
MLISNNKEMMMIGFPESTLTQEAAFFVGQELQSKMHIISPDEFFAIQNKHEYQYGVAFNQDLEKRQQVIDIINELDLDCVRYMHDSVVCYEKDIKKVIGRGTFIAPFSTILMGATLGDFCAVETYCLISHHVKIGNNVMLHSGTMIAGRTTIGDNCVFNFKSAALNKLTVGDNVMVNAISTLTKDALESGVYIGSPARRFSGTQ